MYSSRAELLLYMRFTVFSMFFRRKEIEGKLPVYRSEDVAKEIADVSTTIGSSKESGRQSDWNVRNVPAIDAAPETVGLNDKLTILYGAVLNQAFSNHVP